MPARKSASENSVNERAQHFLKVLIERYIRDGEPVGSRTLARDAGMDLSPATIRNVMADLEDVGLITSPHTSAGRVPTVDGYRMFIDSLLTLKHLNESEIDKLKSKLGNDQSSAVVLESASRILSSVTHMAGVVMMPRRDHVSFLHIEFLPLSEDSVMVILVTKSGEVLNRIITTKRSYSAPELEQVANYINQTYSGHTLTKVRESMINEMHLAKADMNRIMTRAIEMTEQVLDPVKGEGDCLIAGQTNLMNFNELSNMHRLRQLFDAFNEKHEIVQLLDGCLHADGVQIFIGEESGYSHLDKCSIVTAPYEANNEVVGVLGVIGPKRMEYDRVIPVVDVTAKLLSSALKQL
ncbi:MAG: heat-inducible transcriptional repressor HrcA [Gammaproteobacteria bacterium]|nr:heat-inducible transcriptional repressor HrcA [Gammaproteobacteria bacterium]